MQLGQKLFRDFLISRKALGFERRISSQSWLQRQRKDIYKKMSRYDNYRARSAYKLIQIDDKYKFLRPGRVVIEAGAAPGSWTQVICERLELDKTKHKQRNDNTKNGLCLAIDIAAIEPVEGAVCLGNADFTSPFTQASILSWLDGRRADCVLSDMAPKATGQKFLNHTKILDLIHQLVPFAFQVLKEESKSVFLCKIWDGEDKEELENFLKLCFERVYMVKPDASRDDSAESYIYCEGFKGMNPLASELLKKKLARIHLVKEGASLGRAD